MTKVFVSRRWAVPLLLALVSLGMSPSVSAGPPEPTHEVVRSTFPWTLTGACEELSSIATGSVTGIAEHKLVINTRMYPDGSKRVIYDAIAKGTAVDESGATFHFNYSNHAVEDSPPGGFPVQVTMTDQFNLLGNGDKNLHVGFNWSWTYTSPADYWPPVHDLVQISTRGDPIHCDPL